MKKVLFISVSKEDVKSRKDLFEALSDSFNFTSIAFDSELGNRNSFRKNYLLIKSILNSDSYDFIIARGIHALVTTILLGRRYKVVFFLTGLGPLGSFPFRYFYWLFLAVIKSNIYSIIVQNLRDKAFVPHNNTVLMNGSGFTPIIKNDLDYEKCVFAGRFILSKGAVELLDFIETSTFTLEIYGDLNVPAPIIKRLKSLEMVGKVQIKGKVSNWNDLSNAGIALYPTKYNEGVPRFLIESLSVGRFLVSTNVPGCKEIIQSSNGIFWSDLSKIKFVNPKNGERNRKLLANEMYSIPKVSSQFKKALK